MPIHLIDVIAPIVVALIYIGAVSFFNEPQRRHFNAIMIAGAGAAYLNGGFGVWEFAFTTVVTFFAYRGLQSYRFIGIGWLLHTAWDVLHHLYGTPIVPFVATSSLGCAICDPMIAAWCFAGGPSVLKTRTGAVEKAFR
jgi:predicted small integral membrane protein